MIIKLSTTVAPSGAVDEFDILQLKKGLNRLGYYQPYAKTGITGIPDKAIFESIKQFQRDKGLEVTGIAKPNDNTVKNLNQEVQKDHGGFYIWRTVEDEKVRPSHVNYNRTIRAWKDNPTPGDDYNCRCWAEPINQAIGLTQIVITQIQDKPKWDWSDFIGHFYKGGGANVTLSNIGLLSGVVEQARATIFDPVEAQIESKAKEIINGELRDTFARSYDFSDASFSLGNSTIRGTIEGRVVKDDKVLVVDVEVEYLFFDQFTDPLSLRESHSGTSLTKNADIISELGGTSYDILGRWVTKVTGSVDLLN